MAIITDPNVLLSQSIDPGSTTPPSPVSQPTAQANPVAGKSNKLGWPDALIGLSQFIAATKRRRPTPPAPQSFAGIGQPAPQGNIGRGIPQGRTVKTPQTLSQFL